ncbi:unnamed protein product [Parnassius mnemosyne]|uniref:Uncharacterized protein n=1 Tax=Parnassius mnemosyne TaxID=213953 RepID=A0AAV1L0M7_9NEOP
MRWLEVLLLCLLCCQSLAKEYENGSDDAFWISWLKNYTIEPFIIGSRNGGDKDSIPYDKIIGITKEKLSQPLKNEETLKSDSETSAFLQNIVEILKVEPPAEVEDGTGSIQEPDLIEIPIDL